MKVFAAIYSPVVIEIKKLKKCEQNVKTYAKDDQYT